MLTVTAQEYQRHIGKYHQIAMREPITITRHSQPSITLSPADIFQRLFQKETGDVKDDDLQALFTPERLAHINRAREEVKTGKFYTAGQVRDHFAEKSETWRSS